MGLSLPDWCTEEDYEKLEDLAHLSYLVLTYTPLMTRIVTGPTVEKFLENIENSGKGPNGKKVYLYSAHEINIAQFGNAHNFTEVPKIPDYGCALIVEKLRGPDNQVYVRVRFFYIFFFSHKMRYTLLLLCSLSCGLELQANSSFQ